MKMFKFVTLLMIGSMGVMKDCAFADYMAANKKASQAVRAEQPNDEKPDAAPSDAEAKKQGAEKVQTASCVIHYDQGGHDEYPSLKVPEVRLVKDAAIADLRRAVKEIALQEIKEGASCRGWKEFGDNPTQFKVYFYNRWGREGKPLRDSDKVVVGQWYCAYYTLCPKNFED